MAPRFSRRRRDEPEDHDASGSDADNASLDSDEHAWWAQREIDAVWTPRDDPTQEPLREAERERDVLAEHFGDDWRTSFGFDSPAPPALEAEVEPLDRNDPYAVLEIDPTAEWKDIVNARRRLARRHHPDRVSGKSDDEIRASEDRIRAINAAYAELKVRRDK